MSRCRSCQAEVIWAKTERDRWMPVDAEPVERGNVILVQGVDGHGPPLAVVASEAGSQARYTSHFATCPNAAEHRLRREELRDHGR